ncbi:MAG TPA: flagellar biosynthetic protein FliO [Polyangiaceae bacterium]|nr:flagellar biosynthetic protein FliO [Polyangiaceae bacterium]
MLYGIGLAGAARQSGVDGGGPSPLPWRLMTPLSRYVLETTVSLLLILGLAIAILYAARKGGVGRPTGPLQLVGRVALDARRVIYLVRVGNITYVVGGSEAGLTKLGEHDSDTLPDTGVAEQATRRSFREVLSWSGGRRSAEPPKIPPERQE